MKQLLQLFAIGLLTFCSSPEQRKDQEENAETLTSDSVTEINETNESAEIGDGSHYPIEAQRINKLAEDIDNQDLVTSNYIYYNENGEKWELSTYRNKEKELKEISLSLGFESQQFTSYYLDHDKVCLIQTTQMGLGNWINDRYYSYYIKNGNPFYESFKHNYKGEFITNEGSDLAEFNKEDHAFAIYRTHQELEDLVSRSIPEELHVVQGEFIPTDYYELAQGSAVPEVLDRTEGVEFYTYHDIPSVKTTFDEASNKSSIIVIDEGEVMYEANFEGKLHFSGFANGHILLEIPNGNLTYDLAIIDQVASKITYRKPAKGQVFKNGKLLVMREVKNEEIERISFKGDCSEFESQGNNYKRYGVFEVTVGTSEDKFTNQVFCISDVKK